MNYLKLLLPIVPVLFPLFKLAPVIAAEAAFERTGGEFCVSAHQKLVCVRASQLKPDGKIDGALIAQAHATASDPDRFVDFSDEESDAANKLFGCDCPACIRSLRQLRTLAPIN